jgi:2-oxoglutarate ferredoxin oxidoreductase subunit alpha
MIREAVWRLGKDNLAFLYFKQVHPLHPSAADYFGKAEQLVVIENNAVSQFSSLIKLHTGFDVHRKILKYNGLPFSVEELEESLRNVLS